MPFCKMILVFIGDPIVSRAKLSLKLLSLRHQLVVFRRAHESGGTDSKR